jgi:FMN phosphatase YigB (HAD superfamily)
MKIMTLTLLLDLDDTLIENDQNAFFAAFAKTMISSLSRHASAETLAAGFQSGVQAMFLNRDPALTLAEAFYQGMLAKVPGLDKNALQEDINNYYREVYPTLSAHTRQKPEAVRLVDWALSQGYRLAIATNPFFTYFAVQERLRWAGLPPEKYPFSLLTSNESFHFAKSPVYFAELMGRLGWPDEPVLMVGDDLNLDIIPSQAIGIPSYHIVGDGTDGTAGYAGPRGGIESVRPWLEETDFARLRAEPNSREAILATLLSTPATLSGLLAELPVENWTRRPFEDEWSITEIICHLRDVDAEVNLPRLRSFLQETNPFILGQSTDEWVEERAYDKQDGQQALKDLTRERKALVATLEALSPQSWQLRARHSIFGPTDLREMAGFIAEHDRVHIQQVFKTINQICVAEG